MDPPRPPKDGCEWVWFPAGYWAERQIVETPTKEAVKGFKWRKRSGKVSASTDTQQDIHEPAIGHLQDLQLQQLQANMPLPSPYLTEEAHVLSLQRPTLSRDDSSESTSSYPTSFPHRSPKPPLPTPYAHEDEHLTPTRPPTRRNNSSSFSGNSFFKMSRAQQSSPLASSKGNRGIVASPPASNSSTPRSPFSMASPGATEEPPEPPKRSLISWLRAAEPKTPKKVSSRPVHQHSSLTLEGKPSPSGQNVVAIGKVASLLRQEIKRPHRTRPIKLFGKSPWHRPGSGGSDPSTTSSIRDVLRGVTPTPSPASERVSPCGA
ncbi:hypothetical protein F4780DRAFT_751370 [Xylariomycetidae sp. FL0641]|nr:hypothetical protein F4780DRAFT_751370 [Xylariomycetidae sp. FL0641]